MIKKNVLVAFFSRAGENFFPGGTRFIEKGNTHVAAELLKEITDADLFEIKPQDGYSDVYKECVMRAKQEFDTNARPALAEDVDISDYEVIYLGYPNWCGTMPMPVWTFLENHDFAGKVICPFCTNEGSGLANSIGDIQKLAPSAEVKAGLSIKGSEVQNAGEAMQKWVNEI